MKVGELIIDLQTSLAKFNRGITDAQSKLTKFGRNTSQLGKSIGIAGGLITATFGMIAKKGLKTFAGVQQQLRETKSLIGPVGASFKQLDKIVDDLGITTKFTQKALADGLRQIASAGIKQESQMREVLASASDLASAIGTDLNTAISHTLGMTEAFGKELGGTSAAADVMANLVRSARIESDGLGDILKYASGVTKAFKGNIKDSMAAIAGFAQITGDARQGAVYFRGAMTQLSKQTEKQKQVLDDLGLTFNDINPEIHNIVDIIETLKDANISGAQSTALLGSRAMTFQKIVESVIPRVREVRNALDEQGTASKMASDNLKTLQGDYVLMTSSVEALWKQLGESLSPAFRELFKDLKKVIDNVINFIRENKLLVSNIVILGLKIGILLTTLGGLLFIIGKIVMIIPVVSTGLATIGVVLTTLTTAAIGAKISLFAMAGGLTLVVAIIGTTIKLVTELVSKTFQLVDAQKKANEAQIKLNKLALKSHRITKDGIKLTQEWSIEKLKALKDENKAYEISKQIAISWRGWLTSQRGKITQEVAQSTKERIGIYTAFYKELESKFKEQAQKEKEEIEAKLTALETNHSLQLEEYSFFINQKWEMDDEYLQFREQTERTGTEIVKTSLQERFDGMQKYTQAIMNTANTASKYFNIKIKNDEKKDLDSAKKRYEDKKKWINENIKDEEERTRQLGELEESYYAEKQNIIDDAAEKERESRRKMKPLLIAEAIANTAVGATKAFAQGGILGFVTAGLVTIAGMFHVATIRAQKFARGVRNFAGGMAMVGEMGPELINLPRGTDVYNTRDTKAILAGGGGSSVVIENLNVKTEIIEPTISRDIDEVMEDIAEATKEGTSEAINMVKAIANKTIEVEDES